MMQTDIIMTLSHTAHPQRIPRIREYISTQDFISKLHMEKSSFKALE